MAEEEEEEAADQLAPFDPTKKKKKKKKEVVIQDPSEQLARETETLSVSKTLEPTFTGLKKKKKKKKKKKHVQTDLLDDEKENAVGYPIGDDEEAEGIVLQQQKLPWEGTDRDYKYEELLGQVFHILR